MQSTKDKLIVSGLFISIILGLIPVGVNIALVFAAVAEAAAFVAEIFAALAELIAFVTELSALLTKFRTFCNVPLIGRGKKGPKFATNVDWSLCIVKINLVVPSLLIAFPCYFNF
jgi:hypothetical protein